ncbi:MAG: ComEC/Rec2 family competence protein [Oscillospiraceae bacterium]
MKRPLALFGGVYLIAMLAAVQLPAAGLLPVALLLPAVLLAVAVFAKQKYRPAALLALAAALLAGVLLFVYRQTTVLPLRRLEGQSRQVVARATQTAPGYSEETMRATLQVLEMEGEALPRPFYVQVDNFAEIRPGSLARLELSFYRLGSRYAPYYYADNVYIGARAATPPQISEGSATFTTALRRLQQQAGDNLHSRLPLRLSGVLAAIAFGDVRYLPDAAKQAYRAAGLSHVLVVSGGHLSLLCGYLYLALCKVTRRRKAAAALCMGAVVAFAVFTGMSVSILRSAFAYLLLYGAVLLGRRADVATSLGAAALVLCTVNPYAAADAGLLLSFSAAAGTILGGQAAGVLTKRFKRLFGGRPYKIKAFLRFLFTAAVVAGSVTLATLPVLLLFGFGLSLFTIPANIVAAVLLPPVLVLGFLAALPPVPVLAWLAQGAAFLAGVFLVWLEKLVHFCASVPAAYFYIGGVVAAAVLLLYPLCLLAYKSRRVLAGLLAGLALLAFAAALQGVFLAGTVHVVVAGGGQASALVVVQGGEALVIYREKRSFAAIQQVLQQQNVRQCALFVDLRTTPQSTEYIGALQPQKVVVAAEEPAGRAVYIAFINVSVYLVRQGEGLLACVDIGGYRICLATGRVALGPYAAPDIVVAGRGAVEGPYGKLLACEQPPEWAEEGSTILYRGDAHFIIRPGKSVLFREEYNGVGYG